MRILAPGPGAIVLLPALLFSQVGAIVAISWGALARIKQLGLWASTQNKKSFLEIWRLFRALAEGRSLWGWLKIAWLTLGSCAIWTVGVAFLGNPSKADGSIPLPFLCVILSVFFLGQALGTAEALANGGVLVEPAVEDPNGPISPG